MQDPLTKKEYPAYMECPCKGCTFETGRTVTCHDHCSKYISWKEWYEVMKRVEKREKLLAERWSDWPKRRRRY